MEKIIPFIMMLLAVPLLCRAAPAAPPLLRASGTSATAGDSDSGMDAAPPPDNMFHVPWERKQTKPFPIVCCPTDSVLIELPYPATGWAGRGFSPQNESNNEASSSLPVAADFFVYPGNIAGHKTFVVTARVNTSQRTMHIFMTEGRRISLEFYIVNERDYAFRGVSFVDEEAATAQVETVVREERDRAGAITRSNEPPAPRYQRPTGQTQTGLINFMKVLLSVDGERAHTMAKANPALQFVMFQPGERSTDFGDYEVNSIFAIRDSTTDSLGIAAVVKNKTPRRLLFDPAGWILRAGDYVYPVPTVDFPGVIEPGKSVMAYLVLARDMEGKPTLLLPTTRFQISPRFTKSENPRPLIMQPLELN